MENAQPAKVLTIAGSDSGGAAGLQADLKTFTALGVYGMSAVTVVTAQNSVEVAGVQLLSPQFVAAQIDVVLQDYGADAAKTGFLGSAALIEQVSLSLQPYRQTRPFHLVVDPVLVNHRGEPMFGIEVVNAYRRWLLPESTVLTPNRREAALLCENDAETWEQMVDAAQQLCAMGARRVLITGVWRDRRFGDLFYDGEEVVFLEGQHLKTAHTHGSGDTLSAALTAYLAQGYSVVESVHYARAFTARAIKGSAAWRMGGGHGPLNHFFRERPAP